MSDKSWKSPSNDQFSFEQKSLVIGAIRSRSVEKQALECMIKSEIKRCLPKVTSLDVISNRYYVSSRTLSRRLRGCNLSYRKLLAKVRYESAIELLRDTDLSIGRIAVATGYNDSSNFVKAFKGWTGMTPTSFRLEPRVISPGA